MILDSLVCCAQYVSLHRRFVRAFEFLTTTDLAALPAGSRPILGDELYVSIDHVEGRGREGTRLEAHRNYIDIQVTIEGAEEMGWRALRQCRQIARTVSPTVGSSDDQDVRFYEDSPLVWFAAPPGHFAVFFPEDAHAPLGGLGPLKKAIVKVRVR